MHKNTSYGKSFVIVTSLLFFFEFGLNNIFNALQPHIAGTLNLSPTAIGVISSMFFYVEVILLIPAGLLLDKYSPKKNNLDYSISLCRRRGVNRFSPYSHDASLR